MPADRDLGTPVTLGAPGGHATLILIEQWTRAMRDAGAPDNAVASAEITPSLHHPNRGTITVLIGYPRGTYSPDRPRSRPAPRPDDP